jgi:predicted GTPase
MQVLICRLIHSITRFRSNQTPKKLEKRKEKTKDGKKQKEMQSKYATRIDVRSIMGTSTAGKSSTCL